MAELQRHALVLLARPLQVAHDRSVGVSNGSRVALGLFNVVVLSLHVPVLLIACQWLLIENAKNRQDNSLT